MRLQFNILQQEHPSGAGEVDDKVRSRVFGHERSRVPEIPAQKRFEKETQGHESADEFGAESEE